MANSLACKCELTLGALGTPNCQSIFDVTKRLVFVPQNRPTTGAKYFIDLTSATISTDLVSDSIDGDIIPTGEIKNIEDVRGDSVFQSFNDGSNLKVRDGIRKFTGYFPAVNSGLVNEFESIRGQKIGVMFVDKNGGLIGKTKDYSELLPIMIDSNTFDSRLVKATDSEVQMVMITFEFKITEKDGDLAVLKAEDLTVDLLDEYEFKAPYRGFIENQASTTTETVLNLVHYSGNALSCPITGATDVANWDVFNKTTGLDVVVTAVSELSDGVYELSYSAQTLADKLEINFVGDADFPVKVKTITSTIV